MQGVIAVPGEGHEIPEVTEDFSEAFDEVASRAEARDESDHGAQDDQLSGRGDESAEFGEAFEDAAVNVAATKGEADQEESLIEKVKRLEADNAKLQQSERSQRGRVSALTKKLMERKAATTTEPPKDQGEGEGEGKDGEPDEFDREFPEMAEILNKRVGKVLKKLEAVESKVEEVRSTTDILTEKEIIAHKEQQFDALANDFGHADYQDVLASQEWQQWKAAAPDDIKQKIKSHDAEDAAQVLDAFKQSTGWKAPERSHRQTKSEVEMIKERREKALKRSAGIPTRKVGHRPQGDEDDGDFDAAFASRASKIEHDRATLR
jgi:hypothetical protein